ncbi:pecanex-like protein 2 [Hyalella azteca]|uniref:Pecanex-like protein n=1 Tax=Hyalella azteca TaxID=294128 RepID=A0A979FR72_HYAAZ|nr:pecanex-like protein 2 [Hyalella azteca]
MMGSQSVEILRQGVWASLTGGWFFDPGKSMFCNTFHLYMWLYLACAPFSISLSGVGWWLGWVMHLTLLFIVSALIKAMNYVLHHLFDTAQCHVEEDSSNSSQGNTIDGPFAPHSSFSSSRRLSSVGQRPSRGLRDDIFSRFRSVEAVEMPVMSGTAASGNIPHSTYDESSAMCVIHNSDYVAPLPASSSHSLPFISTSNHNIVFTNTIANSLCSSTTGVMSTRQRTSRPSAAASSAVSVLRPGMIIS